MKTTDANSGNTPELTNEQYFEERKLLLAARQRGYQRAVPSDRLPWPVPA